MFNLGLLFITENFSQLFWQPDIYRDFLIEKLLHTKKSK